MKILAVFLIVVSSLLTGCVIAEPEYRGASHSERDRQQHQRSNRDGPRGDLDRDGIPNRADRDRDGDGVRNSQDRRPDDPRRY